MNGENGDRAEPESSRRVHGTSGNVSNFPAARSDPSVSFDRRELGAILDLYGRKVAMGEWRDYAIDFSRDTAVFSVFRRSSEMPLYRIVKTPSLRNRQGAYAVVASTGVVLKRGGDLIRVLRVLDKGLTIVSS